MTIPPAGNRKDRRGKKEKDRKVGFPIGKQVGLPADHRPQGAGKTGSQISVSAWHLFLDSLSPGAISLDSLSHRMDSSHTSYHNCLLVS